jgi:hypothetical protein
LYLKKQAELTELNRQIAILEAENSEKQRLVFERLQPVATELEQRVDSQMRQLQKSKQIYESIDAKELLRKLNDEYGEKQVKLRILKKIFRIHIFPSNLSETFCRGFIANPETNTLHPFTINADNLGPEEALRQFWDALEKSGSNLAQWEQFIREEFK